MRFALRNKTKLIQAFGEDEYNRILSSLKQHALVRDIPETTSLDSVKYPILNVRSPGEKIYQFAVLGSRWDVIHVAFYGATNK